MNRILFLNRPTTMIEVTNVNDPPFAVDDYYEVDQDGVLDVASPGVLVNDWDPDPTDNIYVDLKTAPEHGTLVLHLTPECDGSFIYTPDPGYFGEDSFEYYMLGIPERQEFTDWATVYITIHPFMEIFLPIFN